MLEPAAAIAEYNPLSFIVEGVRDPVISALERRGARRGARGDRARRRDLVRAQRPRPAAAAEDGRLMERPRPPPRAPVDLARRPGDGAGAGAPRGERAPAGARRGDPGRARADDLLPRADRGLRQPDPAPRLRPPTSTRASSSRSACSRAPGSPAPRPGSTSPATSSRAGSTACSPPPPRARCCWPGWSSRPACAR